MQGIPLAEKLRKRLHRTLSAGQDILVAEAYNAFPSAVLLDVVVRFDASFREMSNYALRPFEMVDGTINTVKTLEQTDLLLEKVSAYMARREVRDLYDVFFLLQMLEDKRVVKKSLNKLLLDFRRPVDEGELRALVISGVAPTVTKMLEVIREWAR